MAPGFKTSAAAAVGLAAVACSLLGFPGTARADPSTGGMHGDPGAAAPYWRYQKQDRDCGEMAVADVIGQITGNQISEEEIDNAAGNIPSTAHAGPMYTPGNRTSNRDLPVLLAHYGIPSDETRSDTAALERALDQGRKVDRHPNRGGARQRQRDQGRARRTDFARHLRGGMGHQRQLRRSDQVTRLRPWRGDR